MCMLLQQQPRLVLLLYIVSQLITTKDADARCERYYWGWRWETGFWFVCTVKCVCGKYEAQYRHAASAQQTTESRDPYNYLSSLAQLLLRLSILSTLHCWLAGWPQEMMMMHYGVQHSPKHDNNDDANTEHRSGDERSKK